MAKSRSGKGGSNKPKNTQARRRYGTRRQRTNDVPF